MIDFVAVTSSDSWFKKHPEKIAGVEFESTSIHFPIQVKGTTQDVLRVTGMLDQNKVQKIKIAKEKAAAFLLKLNAS